MNIRIGVANYASFLQFIDRLRPELPEDVEFVILNDLFTELEESVKRIEADGSVDIFVASGGNADYMQKYLTSIPLVKVQLTGFDIMNAIEDASEFSSDIAVITHSPIQQIDTLKSLIKVNLTPLIYQSPEELNLILQSLYAEGVRDVIGTALVLEQAKLYGLRGHFIWSLNSIRTAIDSAISMARTKKALAEKARMLDYLMDYAAEGIIFTDSNGIITQFNNSAERIIGRPRKSVIGHSCAEVLPNTQLNTVMREKRAQYNRIQDLGNVKIVTNRSPIIYEKEVIGSLATFFSTTTIKQADENIRRSQSFEGYIAKSRFDDMRTRSPEFQELIEEAKKYSRSDSAVLILGATGTRKETFAQCMHNASSQKHEAFVSVNCASIPAAMLEGELFGYEDGVYNGARRAGRAGYLELANQGTLFLNEIGDIPLKLQARLLQAIEDKQFFRIGGSKPVPVDVRFIASSNKDLRAMVRDGGFREELYYLIDVLEIALPGLNQRKCDIPTLIEEIIDASRGDLSRSEIAAISNEPIFQSYEWPGNIRELHNVIERFCVLFTPGMDIKSLAKSVMPGEADIPAPSPAGGPVSREEILTALKLSNGNKSTAASILDISRTTLWRRMRELKMVTE